jgi:hypothetical protein
MPAGRRLLPAAVLAAGLAAAGCGSSATQADDEPRGSYRVQVLDASFPAEQEVAGTSELKIAVRNTGTRALPDLAVTLDSLQQRSEAAGLSSSERPTWVVDQGPRGADSAYTDTWSVPDVPPGQTRTLTWKVTAMVPGRHEVRWRVNAGLDGRARAVSDDGGAAPEGTFAVDVSDSPEQTAIDPETGAVTTEDGATVAAPPAQ